MTPELQETISNQDPYPSFWLASLESNDFGVLPAAPVMAGF